MTFYVGVPEASWLERLTVPAMVSIGRLARRRPVTAPTVPAVVVDSGAYMALHRHGRWTTTPAVYARQLVDLTGGLPVAWAAPQDWPCEPGALAATGRTVAYHQAATIDSVLALRAVGAPVIPVLQGWTATDYLAHVDAYAAAGVDLTMEAVVGVGSTCRRTYDVTPELRLVAWSIGPRLHAFGVKGQTWRRARPWLVSADSMAWSATARRDHVRLAGCTHRDCRSCPRWAAAWAYGMRVPGMDGVAA